MSNANSKQVDVEIEEEEEDSLTEEQKRIGFSLLNSLFENGILDEQVDFNAIASHLVKSSTKPAVRLISLKQAKEIMSIWAKKKLN